MLPVGESAAVVRIRVGGIRSQGEDHWVVVACEVIDRLCVGVTQAAGNSKVNCAMPSIPPTGNHRGFSWGCDCKSAVSRKFVESSCCCVGISMLIPRSVLCIIITHGTAFRSVSEGF
ncbi:hypothetical protein TNCV_2396861 [Trichonephila clavipes]|uniref:Uncharacterized protein n=1 Tax=Trichonephila clavipes TaxID=2585209 RepID=A0A8X6VQW0_TRICX|nr:hypothetical protein TNCV_2396861 [Trichonephila clavipes]